MEIVWKVIGVVLLIVIPSVWGLAADAVFARLGRSEPVDDVLEGDDGLPG